MKATLQVHIGQQIALTPQLQMAIRLLQLSTVDLHNEVQQAIETNPLLETYEEEDLSIEQKMAEYDKPECSDDNYKDTAELDLQTTQLVSDEMPVDTNWEEIYQQPILGTAITENNIDWLSNKEANLFEHLMWQVELTPFTDIERAIAITLIDSIDEDGMLDSNLKDIQEYLNQFQKNVSIEEIEGVLKKIHEFEPVGVGARNIQECLLIQLQDKPEDTPWIHEAFDIINNYFTCLVKHEYDDLQKGLNLSHEKLQNVLQLIQSLNPRPGAQLCSHNASAIIPDIIVKKEEKRWVVELNLDALPKLRINKHYMELARQSSNDGDHVFLRNQLQEARWFIKSLQSRHETLLKVATAIVERQQGFLQQGAEAMKPLVLRDIAEVLGVHESTISRVTTQKYMYTPQGVFELKYFFSSHIVGGNGEACSSIAIRALIKKLISAENSKRPLSDSKIVQILEEQGILIARRTVAKYRELMAIPPSHDRKYLT
ncbi:MAG: RNA polymerase sigma-54 factor [Legionellaceae bacterium]